MAWFRMLYSRNAFVRSLDGRSIDSLSLPEAVAAMEHFMTQFRPQHAESDAFECSWGPAGDRFVFALTRRMVRHGHPEATLSLGFEYALTPPRSSLVGAADGFAARSTEGYRAVSRARIIARRVV